MKLAPLTNLKRGLKYFPLKKTKLDGGNMNIGMYTFEEFKEIATKFHGFPAPGLLIGGFMVELAKKQLPRDILYDAVVETNKCLPDAVQLLTPCTFGNGWMKVYNLGRYALSLYNKYTGEGVRVFIDTKKLDNFPHVKNWFLKLLPKKEQDTVALLKEIEEAGEDFLSIQKVKIKPRVFEQRKMRGIKICPLCKEAYPSSDGVICRGCQGENPYLSLDVKNSCEESCGPELKKVPINEAIGKQALHDMTMIIPGEKKGAEIKAGDLITVGDLCRLQRMGKFNVYERPEDLDENLWIHENIGAKKLSEYFAGENVFYDEVPKEGKVNFYAKIKGLLQYDVDILRAFNMISDVMCSARQNNIVVEKDKPFAGCRIIPLYIHREKFYNALSIIQMGSIFNVLPLKKKQIGILVTGTEVFNGVIEDKFYPIIKNKVEKFDCKIVGKYIVPDNRYEIASKVKKLIELGAEVIITTAGLSVDPDDCTRAGLIDAGLDNFVYGAPILPGAMTLVGKIKDVYVMGVPACALYYKSTSFDLLFPRILAGQIITRKELSEYADGGFCLNCKMCTFPKCPFGK